MQVYLVLMRLILAFDGTQMRLIFSTYLRFVLFSLSDILVLEKQENLTKASTEVPVPTKRSGQGVFMRVKNFNYSNKREIYLRK